MKRDAVDFHLVEDRHLEIHARLEAWANWVKVRPHGWQVAPMFRYYRPDNWHREAPQVVREQRSSVNVPEAIEMESLISQLPGKQREAIRWCYFWSTLHPLVAKGNGWEHGPLGMARRLGVTKQGLLDLIQAARSTLSDRSE